MTVKDRISGHQPRSGSGLVWKNLVEVPFAFYLEVKEIRLPSDDNSYRSPLMLGVAYVKPDQAVEDCPLPTDEEVETSFFVPQSFATQLRKLFGEDWTTSAVGALLYVDYQGMQKHKGTSFYSFFIENCEDQEPKA